MLVLLVYGGLIWGVLPGNAGVSWQAHLGGAAGGVFAAWLLHRRAATRSLVSARLLRSSVLRRWYAGSAASSCLQLVELLLGPWPAGSGSSKAPSAKNRSRSPASWEAPAKSEGAGGPDQLMGELGRRPAAGHRRAGRRGDVASASASRAGPVQVHRRAHGRRSTGTASRSPVGSRLIRRVAAAFSALTTPTIPATAPCPPTVSSDRRASVLHRPAPARCHSSS